MDGIARCGRERYLAEHPPRERDRRCRDCGQERPENSTYCSSCKATRRMVQNRENVRAHRARKRLHAAEQKRTEAADRRKQYLRHTGWAVGLLVVDDDRALEIARRGRTRHLANHGEGCLDCLAVAELTKHHAGARVAVVAVRVAWPGHQLVAWLRLLDRPETDLL